jgi:hypothetical protein
MAQNSGLTPISWDGDRSPSQQHLKWLNTTVLKIWWGHTISQFSEMVKGNRLLQMVYQHRLIVQWWKYTIPKFSEMVKGNRLLRMVCLYHPIVKWWNYTIPDACEMVKGHHLPQSLFIIIWWNHTIYETDFTHHFGIQAKYMGPRLRLMPMSPAYHNKEI